MAHYTGKKRTCKREESTDDRETKMMKFVPETLHSELFYDLGVEVLHHSPSDDEHDFTITSSKDRLSTHSPTNQMALYDIRTPSPVRSFPVHNTMGQICSCHRVKHVLAPENRFQSLTNEVILYIFKWLPLSTLLSCACVCKRWKVLAYDDSLWRRINLTGYHFHPGTLGQVLVRGCNAVKLAQASIMGPLTLSSQPQIYSLRRTCKKRKCQSEQNFAIKYLDLSSCKIDDDYLLHDLLSRCNKLCKLSLECCHVNPSTIATICSLSGPTLEELNLCMCTGITQDAIDQILLFCKRLKSLNLSWCDLKSVGCLNPFFTRSSLELKYLNLSGYRLWMTDLRVKMLLKNFPNLLDLDLSDSSLTTKSVQEIVDNLRELRHLSLSRCYGIDEYSLVKFKSMKHIQGIEVFGTVSKQALNHLKVLMPKIRINQCPFSAIARPTTRTARKNSIWNVTCWD